MTADPADWVPRADDNASTGGSPTTDIAESNYPRTVNDALRDIVAVIAGLNRPVTFFDDFLAGAIDARISSTAGGGANTEALTVVADSVSGLATLKTSDANASHAADASNVTLDQLNFKAEQGGLAMEARLSIDDVTNVAIFVGFTDAISTTVEMPVYKASASDDLDADAADACGVGFDTQGTTDEWWHGGVKAGTDTAAVHAGGAPSNGTSYVIRVEVTAAGAVRGFIDGVAIGAAVDDAVTASANLTPVVVITNRTTAQRVATVDYFFAQQSREA